MRTLLIFLCSIFWIVSCSFIPKSIKKIVADSPPKSKREILSHPIELDSISRVHQEKFGDMMDYIVKKKKTTAFWTLQKLKFTSDESKEDSSVYLSVIFNSRGRYNSKFTTFRKRKQSEWKKNGKEFLSSWELPLEVLLKNHIGIKILVQYKHKNYLRPNEKLVRGNLPITITPKDLTKAQGSAEILYRKILNSLELAQKMD